MFNVLQSAIPQTHARLHKLRFFVLRKLEIVGQALSLYSFENDVIRPQARSRNEPRVHFALTPQEFAVRFTLYDWTVANSRRKR